MISKTIHVVWIGDEEQRPDKFIQTWRTMNPLWNIRLWGNKELRETNWINSEKIRATSNFAGKADMMRYEILYKYGGFAVDADAECLRPLEDWIFQGEVIASWENEFTRPNLIANGYLGAVAQNKFIRQVIEDIKEDKRENLRVWEQTGPVRLTNTWRAMQPDNVTIWPSHLFIPEHYTGMEYKGSGPVFARQYWGNTRGIYKELAELGR